MVQCTYFVMTLLPAYFGTSIIGALLVHFLLTTVLIHIQYETHLTCSKYLYICVY
jgi:hypothetical protein